MRFAIPFAHAVVSEQGLCRPITWGPKGVVDWQQRQLVRLLMPRGTKGEVLPHPDTPEAAHPWTGQVLSQHQAQRRLGILGE